MCPRRVVRPSKGCIWPSRPQRGNVWVKPCLPSPPLKGRGSFVWLYTMTNTREALREKLNRCWVENRKTLCREWVGVRGRVSRNSYGRIMVDGKMMPAHRLAWELKNGPIPDGLVVDHMCRNMRCVNTDHLRVVTIEQNVTENSTPAGAMNKLKTHCPNGHPYDEANTLLRPIKWTTRYGRWCKACRDVHNAKVAAVVKEKRRNRVTL